MTPWAKTIGRSCGLRPLLHFFLWNTLWNRCASTADEGVSVQDDPSVAVLMPKFCAQLAGTVVDQRPRHSRTDVLKSMVVHVRQHESTIRDLRDEKNLGLLLILSSGSSSFSSLNFCGSSFSGSSSALPMDSNHRLLDDVITIPLLQELKIKRACSDPSTSLRDDVRSEHL